MRIVMNKVRQGDDPRITTSVLENEWSLIERIVRKTKPLLEKNLENCKVISDRIRLLDLFPKNSVCAELGVAKGAFAELILEKTSPKKLHLIEKEEELCKDLREMFKSITSIEVHKGYSYEILEGFPDQYFDCVYVDSEHDYETTKKELDLCKNKVKEEGLIGLHDYIWGDFVYKTIYGVIEAVNNFCLEENYEIIYLTLEYHMYNTVVLRRRV